MTKLTCTHIRKTPEQVRAAIEKELRNYQEHLGVEYKKEIKNREVSERFKLVKEKLILTARLLDLLPQKEAVVTEDAFALFRAKFQAAHSSLTALRRNGTLIDNGVVKNILKSLAVLTVIPGVYVSARYGLFGATGGKVVSHINQLLNELPTQALAPLPAEAPKAVTP